MARKLRQHPRSKLVMPDGTHIYDLRRQFIHHATKFRAAKNEVEWAYGALRSMNQGDNSLATDYSDYTYGMRTNFLSHNTLVNAIGAVQDVSVDVRSLYENVMDATTPGRHRSVPRGRVPVVRMSLQKVLQSQEIFSHASGLITEYQMLQTHFPELLPNRDGRPQPYLVGLHRLADYHDLIQYAWVEAVLEYNT